MCPAALGFGQVAVAAPAIVDIHAGDVLAEKLVERLAAPGGMDQKADGVGV